LYHVVCVRVPASYVAEVAPEISLKPVLLLVVDNCHLYSSVPVWPLAAALLVKAAGSNPVTPLCAAAMVPPEVGFTHCVTEGVKVPLLVNV
jgi:hypothetical protein